MTAGAALSARVVVGLGVAHLVADGFPVAVPLLASLLPTPPGDVAATGV